MDLKVVWNPNPDKALSGEVKGNLIKVYDTDEEEALRTLRHEYLDFIVSQSVEPYRRVANLLIKLLNDEAYNRKEKIVKGLSRLLFEREVRGG